MASEASTLLKHPNPAERQLALKLDSVEPEDVARAILDPHPGVWQAAFNHPESELALTVLANSSRDAAGYPIHDRHDLLLRDPRCTPDHIKAMHRAIQNDAWLPIQDQAKRLELTGSKLEKKEPNPRNQIFVSDKEDPIEAIVKVSQEEPTHPDLLKSYNATVHSSSPIQPEHAELANPGAASPKVVYQAPPEHGNHKFLVKPYLEGGAYHAGWWEQTSHALFNAGGIGHTHQKSFVGSYDNLGRHIPAIVIKVEKATPIHKWLKEKLLYKNPKAPEEARKIGVMDFLLGNKDRHLNNLMVRDDGSLLAIDHGRSGDGYGDLDEEDFTPSARYHNHLPKFTAKALAHITDSLDNKDRTGGQQYYALIKDWWPKVSGDVRDAFEKRMQLLPKGVSSNRIRKGYEARHQWLDRVAGVNYDQFLQELKKAVLPPVRPPKEDEYDEFGDGEYDDNGNPLSEKPRVLTEVVPKFDKSYKPAMTKLAQMPPAHMQDSINHFESVVNHPDTTIEGQHTDNGFETKTYVSHQGKRYLIKGMHAQFRNEDVPLGGWKEMANQAMYHAAGIGHLHQDVHISQVNYKKGPDEKPTKQLATIVHFKPGNWVPGADLSQSQLGEALGTYADDLRKIRFMDELTTNWDRHGGNIMFNEETLEPQAIDHGFLFKNTPGHYFLDENAKHDPEFRAFHPTKETYQWWKDNRQNIIDAFEKHIQLLPKNALRKEFSFRFYDKVKEADQAAEDAGVNVLAKHVEAEEYPGGFMKVIGEKPQDAARYDTVHDKLLTAHPAHLQPKVDRFEQNVNHPAQAIKPDRETVNGVERKSLVTHAGHKYLIKAANTPWNHLAGWGELTSQALAHAAGIGHLHQHSHATHLNIKEGNNTRRRQAVVIHFKPGNWHEIGNLIGSNRKGLNFDNPDDLRKAYVMDFLTGNSDRHSENLLIDKGSNYSRRRLPYGDPDITRGSVQLIDHGFSFRRDNWHDPADQENYTGGGLENVPREKKPFNWKIFRDENLLAQLGLFANKDTEWWWLFHRQPIIDTFEKHLLMLPDKAERDRRRNMFMHRVAAVDSKHPVVYGGEMAKSLNDADFLHNQHAEFAETAGDAKPLDLSGLHEKLMKAHPAVINPGVRHFEISLNNNQTPIQPQKSIGRGVQSKAIYKSGGKKYLVKPAIDTGATQLGAWNELTSQAMYHAGGIGHLHQKVHATMGKTGLDRAEPAHALAVHMEPLSMTYFDSVGYHDPETGLKHAALDPRRAQVATSDPKHVQSLKKMGLMDYLTGNLDRHGHNIVLKGDASPIAIDHGRAFYQDRKHALGDEVSGSLMYQDDQGNWVDEEPYFTNDPAFQHGMFAHNPWDKQGWSGAADLGGAPDKETWDWWHQAKGPMLEKFKEHVAMLPREAQQKMLNSYMQRHNRLDELSQGQSADFSGQDERGAVPSDIGNAKTDISIPMALPPPTIRRT